MTGAGENSGWWLKITSPEELADYHEKHNDKYGRALLNIVQDKDSDCTHGPAPEEIPLAQAAYYHAINQKISPVISLLDLSYHTSTAQLNALHEYGAIYINSVGGWNWGTGLKISQHLWKEGFAFPNFTKSDIRISKFPGGQHYYAHIGPMEVRDGDTIKWSTREEAYRHAIACLPKQ